MALNYSSKHDISYASYNNKTIPWKVNTSIISQNNQNTNPSLNLGTINNNLVIESSQNDILFITSQNDNDNDNDNDNKKVIVKNNMDVDVDLDVSNNLTTKLNVSYDISLNNILYFPSLPVNIIGDLKVGGAISVQGKTTPGLVKSESQFVNLTLSGGRFTDVSIISSTISISDFSNVNIINSYINAIPNGFGYDKSNNALPNKAIFSDVSLQRLILDSSINSSYINFANNTSNAISIRSSADYSKLVISKPLNVGIGTETITNISNISIFYGDISCNNLYYSRLVPDIKLNNYSDVSIGEVSISGNNVPTSNMGINIGSNAYKFNNTYSTYFNGDLSGQATLANNLIKNLDMSFNNLDICGTITLNNLNLNQFLSSDLISIVDSNSSFITISNKVRDLSAIVYTKSDFDLCLNTYITKINLLETSFVMLNGNITSISNSVYSKSDFDLCLNTHITKISLLETSFIALNGNITSISNSVYSKSDFDLCLNTHITKISLLESSFVVLNGNLTSSVYSKSDFDLCLNRNLLRTNDLSAIVSVVSSPPTIYSNLSYLNSSLVKVNSAKVSDELVFPYAITYIDDNVEDTNIRERISFRHITSQIPTSTTNRSNTSINYTRQYTRSGTNFTGSEPNNSGEFVAVMWNTRSTDGNIKRTWNDVGGGASGPAVYQYCRTFEIARTNLTWQEHKTEARKVAGRDLASILSSAENDTIVNLRNEWNSNANLWIGGIRVQFNNTRDTHSAIWQWINGDPWNYTNWNPGQPDYSDIYVYLSSYDNKWHDDSRDYVNTTRMPAVYVTITPNRTENSQHIVYEMNYNFRTWYQHFDEAPQLNRSLATILNDTDNEAVGELISNSTVWEYWVYIGARRVSVYTSNDPGGITSADWSWADGSPWNYSNFYRSNLTQTVTIIENQPITEQFTDNPINGSSTITSETIFDVYNVKLPCIVASSNGSIIVTATAISSLNIPNDTTYQGSLRDQVSRTAPITKVNNFYNSYNIVTTNTTITTYITSTQNYTRLSGLTTGLFKISENSNNNSNYSNLSFSTIPTNYSCIAITNDGMFVALGKASNVTVYMRTSSTWITLGSPITIDFSAYTNTNVGIIPTQFTENWRKNLQNLAINFNYFTGSATSQLILAFGDTINVIKVYSYSGGTWSLTNGFYSVTGGSWGSNPLRSYSASVLGVSTNTNFGYFVILSQSPSVLGFSVDDKFYTYNCTTTNYTIRGSRQTLQASYNNYNNIIAFKMSSDAEKIIVSNTYYVFIYNWSATNWNIVKTINLNPLQTSGTINMSQATSGSFTIRNGYIIHSFTITGTSIFTPTFNGPVEVLIVGGGGGSQYGGGGGGGGVIYMPVVNVTAGTNYLIVVGSGGASSSNGQDSSAFNAIAAGGGMGGIQDAPGVAGGSGGGGGPGRLYTNLGGVSSGNSLGPNSGFIYGNSGGKTTTLSTGFPFRGAGGGGAGGPAPDTDTNFTDATTQTGPGSGGVGIVNPILGPSYYWGGGGGGNGWINQVGGWGGLGGGGGGGTYNGVPGGRGGASALNPGGDAGTNAGAGGDNTGGGGGGHYTGVPGGRGGSGIVVIRYINNTTPIPAGPRSLDISNISSDECVFAIGFPDVLIDTSANRKARGYVEYWKYSNAIATRLATLVPRKRNIDNSSVDTDEYFFSAGGIKITNANTILVAPNFKFHLSSTNKTYTLAQNSLNWATHNNSSNAKAIVGREIASIENEADNELVKVSARNNNVWIGAMRSALTWVWSDPSSVWNYTSFNSGQPDNTSHTRVEFQSATGTWYDIAETSNRMAVYMTRLQYSLNTFTIFNNFFLHSSGFSSSYANTDIATAVIAKWFRTDSPLTQHIEFRGNGNLLSKSQGIFTTSDIRLKENIVDASPKLEDLLKVRVVNYNLKGSDGTKLIGVVAQELEALFPTLVNNGELSPHDTYLGKTESYKSVKYSCFDVILIKAFQEQMAIINKLSAQLDDLECKTKSLKIISQEHAILKQDLEFLKRENELFKLNINEITMLMGKC